MKYRTRLDSNHNRTFRLGARSATKGILSRSRWMGNEDFRLYSKDSETIIFYILVKII